ncbi:hypothetical protein HDU79_003513 [Rhizoclosmatium sp. JEL0117]|nr:hypothetical protein HDU79_003513 [Rhizoclosmatium sp. JEL0117]
MNPLTFYPFMALGWAAVHFFYLSLYGKPKPSILTDAKRLKTYYKTRTAIWRGLAFTFSTIYGIIIAIVEVWPIHPDAYFPAEEFAPFDPITPFNEGY